VITKTTTLYKDNFYEYLKEGGVPHNTVELHHVDTIEEISAHTAGNYSIDFVKFITVHPTKENYLYADFSDCYRSNMPKDEILDNLRLLGKRIKSHIPGRVGEFGWQARPGELHQSEIPQRAKTILLFKWLSELHKYATLDQGFGIPKQPNDLLVVCPRGEKDYLLWNSWSRQEGTRQRQVMAKSFGFNGPFEDDDCMYAEIVKEDNTYKLKPLTYED